MVELCKDQAGSRFIQQQLECASEKNFTECFEELSTNMFILMLDPFGNYVIQKLFDRGSPEQIQSLGDKLKNKVLTLSLHMYGSRVMQKALETLGLKMKTSLARELKGRCQPLSRYHTKLSDSNRVQCFSRGSSLQETFGLQEKSASNNTQTPLHYLSIVIILILAY